MGRPPKFCRNWVLKISFCCYLQTCKIIKIQRYNKQNRCSLAGVAPERPPKPSTAGDSTDKSTKTLSPIQCYERGGYNTEAYCILSSIIYKHLFLAIFDFYNTKILKRQIFYFSVFLLFKLSFGAANGHSVGLQVEPTLTKPYYCCNGHDEMYSKRIRKPNCNVEQQATPQEEKTK